MNVIKPKRWSIRKDDHLAEIASLTDANVRLHEACERAEREAFIAVCCIPVALVLGLLVGWGLA